MEEIFVKSQGKKLRCGYSTGSCAAAAAGAAAAMLLSKRPLFEYKLLLPQGLIVSFKLEDIRGISTDSVSCAVRKDGGDDIDVTDGLLIYAAVKVIEDDFGAMPDIPDGGWLERSEEGPLIVLSGGTGVGIVTRPGLKEEPGKAAINPVPRQMIFDAVKSACFDYDFQGCLSVEISVPGGEELAEKTFNPRLGIKGGISILGTKGIVRPMSREAFLDSVALQISMLHEEGHSYLLAVPGNYGEAFAADAMNLKKAEPVLYGNFTGELIDMAAELGFRGILFVAHIGKFIKVSGGIMDTHSRMADCRAELAAAAALRAGIGAAGALKILDSVTTDEALALMEEDSVLDPAMQYICGRVSFYLNNRSKGAIEAEAVIYNNVKGELGRTKGADSMIDRILEDYG